MPLKNLEETFNCRNLQFEWQGHWIGGQIYKEKKSSPRKPTINPSNGEEISYFRVSKEAIDDALSHAHKHINCLAEANIETKVEILERLHAFIGEYRHIIIRCFQTEIGKPKWDAALEVTAALKYLRQTIQHKDLLYQGLTSTAQLSQSAHIRTQPIGICAAYLPFSTQLSQFVVNFTAALIAGCPIIVFSSAHGVLFGSFLTVLEREIKLPEGFVQVIFSDFSHFKYALSSDKIESVLYTGSYDHCAEIYRDYRGSCHRQLVLQSGGKNALVVHSTADLKQASKSILYSLCKSSGQLCSSLSRVFVYRSMLDQLKKELIAQLHHLEIGPTDHELSNPFMGPVFSQKGLDKFLRFQTMANREASETISWGRIIESETTKSGYFINPGIHILDKLENSSAYQNNVLFCPDLAIYPYDVLDEAIEDINKTDATLAVSFYGDDEVFASRAHLFQAPNMLANQPTVEIDCCHPLAGRTQYGRHRYQGIGLAWYLIYPQAFVPKPDEFSYGFDWPQMISDKQH